MERVTAGSALLNRPEYHGASAIAWRVDSINETTPHCRAMLHISDCERTIHISDCERTIHICLKSHDAASRENARRKIRIMRDQLDALLEALPLPDGGA